MISGMRKAVADFRNQFPARDDRLPTHCQFTVEDEKQLRRRCLQ